MKQDFAVIKIGPRQEIVSKGDEILVSRIDAKANDKRVFEEVLLLKKGEKIEVGTPNVAGAKVEYQVLGEEKGEKVEKEVYKAKSRYRRHVGARQTYTKIKILSI
jgi:large subunit ribosomal protein L21